MFEILGPKPVQRCTWSQTRNASAERQKWILSQASRRASLTNKQGPGFLGALFRRSEPEQHPYANKPTLTHVQRLSEPCGAWRMERRWGRFGAPNARANPVGHPHGHRARCEPTLLLASRSERAYGPEDDLCISSSQEPPCS